MSATPISPEKRKELEERMATLGIRETDLEEKFILSQGRGGQKMNKTSSRVYLKHLPTGIEVKCGTSRSQAANRFFARRILSYKIEQLRQGNDSPQAGKARKIRKQKAKRARRARARRTDGQAETS